MPHPSPAAPAADLPVTATVDVHPARRTGTVDDRVYGHFLESAFFGNIEGGVLDEGSPLARGGDGPDAGLREDVLALCRALGLPVVRWPGGNFASPYHWEDGTGPRDARPRRLELAWGSEESNRFGTDEFLTWCQEVDAEPYLAHGCRSVDDAVRWVEYTNYAGDTHHTRRRAAAGRAEPWGVRLWGLGNEVYGDWQMGHRPPERYAADALEHARFMRLVDPALRFVAVGQPAERWTRPVLEALAPAGAADFVSLHLYAESAHLAAADAADAAAEFDAAAAQALYVERHVQDFSHLVSGIAAGLGLDTPPAIAMDEWNIRHLEPAARPEPAPGADGDVAPRDPAALATAPGASAAEAVTGPGGARVNRYSSRTTADALYYAGVFHALHRAAGLPAPVAMANTVNLVNANGLIAVRPGGAVRTASYHVWDLYQNHTGRTAVAADVAGPGRLAQVRQGDERTADGGFATRPATVPDLDVSATLDDAGRVRLAVVNRHRTRPVRARLTADGAVAGLPPRARVRDLGADVADADLLTGNTLDTPDRVALRDRGTVELGDGTYTFPPHSVTVLAF